MQETHSPVAGTHTVVGVEQVQTCSSVLTGVAAAGNPLDRLWHKGGEEMFNVYGLNFKPRQQGAESLTSSSVLTLPSSVVT